MRKKLLTLVAIVLVLTLPACGLMPEQIDETTSWSASKLYKEARDESSSGNYEKAVKYYEKLETRYPFGLYAQQAQMEHGPVGGRWPQTETGPTARCLRRSDSHHSV